MPNIYKEIYELIKKGNKEEAKKRLEKLEITSHNEISIQMLQNYIKEQEYLSSLTEEQFAEMFAKFVDENDLIVGGGWVEEDDEE